MSYNFHFLQTLFPDIDPYCFRASSASLCFLKNENFNCNICDVIIFFLVHLVPGFLLIKTGVITHLCASISIR